MTQHALLSASSAHRWLECTAAPLLEAEFPDTTSTYAKEGTLAHAIAELKVRKYAVEPMTKRAYTAALKKLQKDPLYQEEMDHHTDAYLDYIKAIILKQKETPKVVTEQTVEFDDYVPDGFGTADCLIMLPDELYVVDFKYGKGVPVDARDNPQMRLYALGAIKEYGWMYGFNRIHTCIVQPRIDNYSEDVISRKDLEDWGLKVVKPAADEAMSGKGHYKPGSWCRFCRAKQQCGARCQYYADMYEPSLVSRNPALIDMHQLGIYLQKAKELKAWAEDLQEYALTCCLEGKDVPGWKAVEGRGSRAFTDPDAAFEALQKACIPKETLYNYVPLTLAQAEKVVGKKEFAAILGDMIQKNPGKPTLVPESDKRPAVSNVVKAADVFTNMEEK